MRKKGPLPINFKQFSCTSEGMVSQAFGFSYPPQEGTLRPLLERLNKLQEVNMMDIGPGHGYATLFAVLSGHVKRVIAVDIVPEQQQEMKKTLASILSPEQQKSISYFKRDFSSSKPVPEQYLGKFQVTHMSHVLHFLNITQTQNMIRNVAHMMELGGCLFLTNMHCPPGNAVFRLYEEQRKKDLRTQNLCILLSLQKNARHHLWGPHLAL